MNNILLILLAVIFIFFLWVITYRKILQYSLNGCSNNKKMLFDLLMLVHEKIPFLLEVINEQTVLTKNDEEKIITLRKDLIKEKDIKKSMEIYTEIKQTINSIANNSHVKLNKDIGFLEGKEELKKLDEEINLNLLKYNKYTLVFNKKLLKFPGNFIGYLFKLNSIHEL